MAAQASDTAPGAFRPGVFFLRPWTGYGLSRSPTGRVLGRYTAEGRGRVDPVDGSTVVEQRFRFNDGQQKLMSWRIISEADGRFVATEQGSGVKGTGGPEGEDFRWIFVAPTPTAVGQVKARFDVTYSLVDAEEAMSHTRVSRWGIPLGSVTAYYRQT